MISRFPICWSILFMIVMLSVTSESAYSTDEGYGSLLPVSVVHILGLVRWGAWGLFILDGFFTTFRVNRITRYHLRYLIFYGILFLAALPLLANIHHEGALKELVRYVFLLLVTAVMPLQMENLIKYRGVDATLKMLLYNVVVLSLVGIAATLRATGFTFRYTGWVDNPNVFVLLNVFFIVIVLANYIRKTFSKSILIPLLIFLVYVQLAAGSRNGFLCLMVVAGVFMVRSGIKITQTIFILMLFGIGLWLFVTFGPEKSQRVFELSEEDFVVHDTGRAELWEELWPFIRSKWLTGWGMLGRTLIGLSGNSHNNYLSFLIFFGIPGGLAMGLLFNAACFSGWFAQRAHENRFSSVSYLFCGYMISVCFGAAFEDLILGVGSAWSIQIVMAIGFVNALSRPETIALLDPRSGAGPNMPLAPPPEAAFSPDDF